MDAPASHERSREHAEHTDSKQPPGVTRDATLQALLQSAADIPSQVSPAKPRFLPDNLVARQLSDLLDMYKQQLALCRSELHDNRAEIARRDRAAQAAVADSEQKHREDCGILNRQIRDAEETVQLQRIEIDRLKAALVEQRREADALEQQISASKAQVASTQQQLAESQSKFQTFSEDLIRKHKREAVAFQRRLEAVFHERMERAKLKHAQEMYISQQAAVSREYS